MEDIINNFELMRALNESKDMCTSSQLMRTMMSY